MMKNISLKPWFAMALGLAAALNLAACHKANDTETAGQKLDRNIEQARQTSEDAKRSAEQTATEVKQSSKDAMNKAGTVLDDSAITASVKAKLAADAELSAINISVETDHGKVSLSGTAPTDAARTRATTLASTVDGVRTVENHLVVSAGKS